MKSKWNSIWLGFTLGLIAPALLMYCYWKLNYGYMDLDKFIQFTTMGKVYIRLISLFTVINLGTFFLFIWRNCNYSARGILLATFIYALFVAIMKFAL